VRHGVRVLRLFGIWPKDDCGWILLASITETSGKPELTLTIELENLNDSLSSVYPGEGVLREGRTGDTIRLSDHSWRIRF